MKEVKLNDMKVPRGAGGETHQQAGPDNIMTTKQGAPISDDQNTLKIGARGPGLLEDFSFREKMFHFDHERIPERVVHARGFGVHGHFECYESLEDVTMANVFQTKGEKTPVFVRFSTVVGNKGSFDLARDVRGFAVKFYTKEGNWDLVGNNIPVFFIQDAMKFPDLVHSIKQAPDRDFPQAQAAHDNFWDFITLSPESMHMIMWAMSDRAIPRSFRFMEGFGVHTFRLINKQGKSTFVKFHWKPKEGMQSVLWNEAVKINGADPDFHRRDLWDAIQAGNFPEWELGMQLFDDDFADKFDFDILDPTKLIPEEVLPVKIVGKMVLNRCVDNFFAETEQVAFCPQNIVPGIDFSNDPLLQGRNFSYLDTQLKRLGTTNFTEIPINSPKCEVKNYQQDGHMALANPKGRVNYEPNSWDQDSGPRESQKAGFRSFPEVEEGKKTRDRSETFSDHYSQARQFYISQTDIEKGHLADALIFELSKCERKDIRERMVSHLLNIHDELAKKVAEELRIENMPKAAEAAKATRTDLPSSDALSILKNPLSHFGGRKLGVLVTDGIEESFLNEFKASAKKENIMTTLVALKVGGIKTAQGNLIPADQKIDGAPSVLFDAVVLLTSRDENSKLSGEKPVKDFLSDAYYHKKFIAFNEDGGELLKDFKSDQGFHELSDEGSFQSFFKACSKVRHWER